MSDVVGICGLIGTLLFGILSVIFYYRQKSVKLPFFVYDYTLLQTRSHPEIKIFFQNDPVENLCRSRVLFYNRGSKEIRSTDKPTSAWPKIQLTKGSKILSYSVLEFRDPNIGFKVNKTTDDSLDLVFDYLNQDDGGIIEILFENKEKNKLPLSFSAPLAGAKRYQSFMFSREYDRSERASLWNWLFSGLFSMILVLFFMPWGSFYKNFQFDWATIFFTMFFSLSFLLVGVLLPIAAGYDLVTLYRRPVPKWARAYFES